MITDRNRFVSILHPEGEAFHLRISEKIGFATCCDNEFIVRKFGLGSNDFILLRKYILHFDHSILRISGSLEYFPEGKRNIARFDTTARNLVKKRLKHVMVYLIDNNHFFSFIIKSFSKLKPCKTTADDYNFLPGFHETKLLIFLQLNLSGTIQKPLLNKKSLKNQRLKIYCLTIWVTFWVLSLMVYLIRYFPGFSLSNRISPEFIFTAYSATCIPNIE